jgi:hypothetical protein
VVSIGIKENVYRIGILLDKAQVRVLHSRNNNPGFEGLYMLFFSLGCPLLSVHQGIFHSMQCSVQVLPAPGDEDVDCTFSLG